MSNLTRTLTPSKRFRPATPLCPHCTAHTMHLDAAGSRWQCASSTCGYTMPLRLAPMHKREAA